MHNWLNRLLGTDVQVKRTLPLELCLVASGLGGGTGFLRRYRANLLQLHDSVTLVMVLQDIAGHILGTST